jgi:hypothetical protein
MSKSRLYFNNDTQKINFTTAGTGTLKTFCGDIYEEDTRTEHEKFFNMDEKEIYKKYGLVFTEVKTRNGLTIKSNGKSRYEISSDFEAKLWLIKKGFITYHKGKERWNNQALDEGWENGWSPPVKSKAKNNQGKGHVYFVKSKNFHKIGSSSAAQIQRRIKYQKPMEILAVSPKIEDYRKLEKELHHHFADKRVLKYEVFENLTEEDIKYIMNKLGNKIHVKV